MSRLTGHWSALATTFLLVLACAEVQPPPGGEVDKTGPTLVLSSPENGALNVPRTGTVILRFSERVQKPSTGTPIFVSPRPSTDPRIKWQSDRIEITFTDSLAPDQTYIVSLNAAVTDLRNNKLDSAIAVAFSTGATLDSGSVSGAVFQDVAAKAGVSVALYPLDSGEATVNLDSVYPGYLTVTNPKGEFSLQYLPKREFRLIAFIDKDNNGRFRPVSEMFAIPDRRIVIGEYPYDKLFLSLTTWDTVKPEILSASYTQDRLVRLRLSKTISLVDLALGPSGLRLCSLADSLARYPALGFLESDQEESSQITAFCDSLPDGLYRVELQYDLAGKPLIWDSLTVRNVPDKTPPVITTFLPGAAPVFVRDLHISLAFSEPLDTIRLGHPSFLLWEGKSTAVRCRRTWADPFHLTLVPDSLVAGTPYRLDVAEPDLADRSGNPLGDTLKVYTFSSLNDDSLGSITGEITIDLPDRRLSPVNMTFKNLSSGQSFPLISADRSIRLSLPAGKYLLSGFIDTNRNGKRELGSIDPFTLSETAARHPDTVAVRARFETTGLNFEIK